MDIVGDNSTALSLRVFEKTSESKKSWYLSPANKKIKQATGILNRSLKASMQV